MPRGIGDVQRAHTALGTADEVIDQRRVLYRAIAEFASGGAQPGSEELDSPAVRGHLGAVAAGARYDPGRCLPLSELVTPEFVTDVAGNVVRLASSPTASVVLADALRRIGEELRRHDATAPPPELLTDADACAATVFGVLEDGARLAAAVAPGLVRDLLPHIGLFAVLAGDPGGRLGSASAREFPGLVVVPEPTSALEVAEAIVHEGAHQKFFDLAMTRAMIDDPDGCAPFCTPSWAPPGAPAWPLEQAFAAWHAYCCLAVFAARAEQHPGLDLHPDSLLPHASGRAVELGDWLLGQGGFLGRDAHRFLAEMTGRSPTRSHRSAGDRGWVSSLVEGRRPAAVHRCGDRSLVVLDGGVDALELYWFLTVELDQQLT